MLRTSGCCVQLSRSAGLATFLNSSVGVVARAAPIMHGGLLAIALLGSRSVFEFATECDFHRVAQVVGLRKTWIDGAGGAHGQSR